MNMDTFFVAIIISSFHNKTLFKNDDKTALASLLNG